MTILLVRHAQPVESSRAGHEENDRPLSQMGRRQAERLADELADAGVEAIYSSPHRRAVETLAPLAQRLSLEISIVDDLRERTLSPDPLPDWRDQLRRAWQDFSFRLPGGESSAQAQERVRRVLAELSHRHPDQTVAVASHGNLIALALHALASDVVGFAFWAQIPMPAVYRVPPDGAPLGPGFDA